MAQTYRFTRPFTAAACSLLRRRGPASRYLTLALCLGAMQAAQAGSDASAALRQIPEAAATLDYEGTFVNQREGAVQSFRLSHVGGAREGGYTQIETLDGTPRSVISHGERKLTFLPQRKTVIASTQLNASTFPVLFSAERVDAVLRNYEVHALGEDRVAGQACHLSELRPRDAQRYTYRLCTERATGLLLRAQIFDAQQRPIEQVGFTDLHIGALPEARRRALVQRFDAQSGWTRIDVPLAPVRADEATLRLREPVPGFSALGEWRQPMAARAPGEEPVSVVQAVFSDGVTGVSVFVEPVGTSSREARRVANGATHLLSSRQGDVWVTVVGEAPFATLQRFASSIEYKARQTVQSLPRQ